MAASSTTAPLPDLAAELFDDIGIKYQEAFLSYPAQDASLKWLLYQLPAQAHILDLGSGTGRPTAAVLAEAGHDVLGIDISPVMVEVASKQVPLARFEVQDSRVWDGAAAGSLDAVTAYFSFIAYVSKDDIRRLPLRVYRWLKPGGFFVFATNPLDGERFQTEWLGKNLVGSSLGLEECVGAIKEAGFEVVKQEVESFMPRGVEAGICDHVEQVKEEHAVFIWARKPL